jgi:hypothetical protein
VRRRAAAAPALVAVAVLSGLLSGCGNNGLTLAREACTHVHASLQLYAEAQHQSVVARASADRTRAIEELETALPLAAQATSADPQWNPLMITLQEIGRNSEAHLVEALRLQCDQAAQSNEQAPAVAPRVPGEPTPSTLPGQ